MTNHKAKLIGKKAKVRYRFGINYNSDNWFPTREIYKYYDDEEQTVYWVGELEQPKLKVDEKIYIDEYDAIHVIKDVARNTDGGYVYWIDEVVEEIEDDETLKSKIRAEIDEENYKQKREREKREKDQKKNEQLTKDTNTIGNTASYSNANKKKWYHFWK